MFVKLQKLKSDNRWKLGFKSQLTKDFLGLYHSSNWKK